MPGRKLICLVSSRDDLLQHNQRVELDEVDTLHDLQAQLKQALALEQSEDITIEGWDEDFSDYHQLHSVDSCPEKAKLRISRLNSTDTGMDFEQANRNSAAGIATGADISATVAVGVPTVNIDAEGTSGGSGGLGGSGGHRRKLSKRDRSLSAREALPSPAYSKRYIPSAHPHGGAVEFNGMVFNAGMPKRHTGQAQKENKAKPRRWSKEEDSQLLAAVKKQGARNWKGIATQVPGRNHTQCLQRYAKVLKPGLVKGHWGEQEDATLTALVTAGWANWGQIADKIPGRTSKQCRERWFHHLDPRIKRGDYSAEEDELILREHDKLGNKWSQIAAQLEGRTEDAVKIRWKTLNRHKRQGKPVGLEARGISLPDDQKMQLRALPAGKVGGVGNVGSEVGMIGAKAVTVPVSSLEPTVVNAGDDGAGGSASFTQQLATPLKVRVRGIKTEPEVTGSEAATATATANSTGMIDALVSAEKKSNSSIDSNIRSRSMTSAVAAALGGLSPSIIAESNGPIVEQACERAISNSISNSMQVARVQVGPHTNSNVSNSNASNSNASNGSGSGSSGRFNREHSMEWLENCLKSLETMDVVHSLGSEFRSCNKDGGTKDGAGGNVSLGRERSSYGSSHSGGYGSLFQSFESIGAPQSDERSAFDRHVLSLLREGHGYVQVKQQLEKRFRRKLTEAEKSRITVVTKTADTIGPPPPSQSHAQAVQAAGAAAAAKLTAASLQAHMATAAAAASSASTTTITSTSITNTVAGSASSTSTSAVAKQARNSTLTEASSQGLFASAGLDLDFFDSNLTNHLVDNMGDDHGLRFSNGSAGSFNGMGMMRFSNGSLAGMSTGSGSASTSPAHKPNLNKGRNRGSSSTTTTVAPTVGSTSTSATSYTTAHASSAVKKMLGVEPISQSPSLKDDEMADGAVEGGNENNSSKSAVRDGDGDSDGDATRDSFSMAAMRRSLTASC